MGMYDEVRCVYPLPVPGANELMYQTKSFDAPMIDLYEIRADGTLWREAYDIEDRSDPNATGVYRFEGMMTPVNKRWEPMSAFTGEVRFYDWLEPDGWIEWSAYFKDGSLQQLNLIEHTPDIGDGMPVHRIDVP